MLRMFGEKNYIEKLLGMGEKPNQPQNLNLNHAFRILKNTLLRLLETEKSLFSYSKPESNLGVQKKYIKFASVAF